MATDRLRGVEAPGDVPDRYRGTPVGRLLACHNLGEEPTPADRPRLLAVTCMDHRVDLRTPRDFAYVIRTGGASLRGRDFEVSFAVAVGGVDAVAVIGHSDCGMDGVTGREDAFVEGLVERVGWDAEAAVEHFEAAAGRHEVDDPIDFTLAQVERLRRRYPGLPAAPLHYRVEDRRLYLIEG